MGALTIEDNIRIRASWIALIFGVVLLVMKFYAYSLTGSEAILSDALESIVNVVAAASGIFVIQISSRPADKDHPYGHGKVEYFSAAFEGGLIAFASIIICIEVIKAFYLGETIREIDRGIFVILASGLGNACLGLYLGHVGKKYHSLALVASGKHILSDFLTSVGVVTGLILIRFTHWLWLDPIIAILVGGQLAWMGLKLVRESVGGLMDAEDLSVTAQLADLFERHIQPWVIHIHATRVIRAGRHHHVDAHMVVPEFWNIDEAHEKLNEYESQIFHDYPLDGDIAFHLDPCRRAYCSVCNVKGCDLRKESFRARIPLTVEQITNPDEPEEFLAAHQN